MWSEFRTSRWRELALGGAAGLVGGWASGPRPREQQAPAPAVAAGGSAFLQVQGLAKRFGSGKPVFEGVDFTIAEGEFVCIVGHSGCGKTSILNVLAGLEPASQGQVVLDGRLVTGPGLERGVVFQAHALLPWLTVEGNIAFAVQARWPRRDRAAVAAHAARFIDMVGLRDAARRLPAELSGGMKQRVGIARAFATQPRMLLLDEPFGALDALTRGSIQDELLAIVRTTRQTVFMITHDVDEAILLADRILLMRAGSVADGAHAPGHIAATLANTLPRNRRRAELHRLKGYDALRGKILDFLVPGAAAESMAILTKEEAR
jgi:nitrate/nitrite transport system ATP-binding protein